MHMLVTRRVPEIIPIGADELTYTDLFHLNKIHKTDIWDFVICDSECEKIFVNKSLDFAEDIIPLIEQIMDRDYMDDGVMEGLLYKFSDIAGRKAANILFDMWFDWRKKRIKTENKNKAEKILDKIRKIDLKRYLEEMGDREIVLEEIFSIGFGTYDEKIHTDFHKGSKYAFMYGYLCCLEDIENHRIKGLCGKCG